MTDVETAVPDSATPSAVISVIVPAHQATLYLAECLESILAQTRMPDEVIVVDDGSTDDTAAIASGFGPLVRVISTPHAGTAAARNTGIAAATGNVVALCDDDDLWLPDKLRLQLDALGDPSAEAAVFCGASEFLSPDIDPATAHSRTPSGEVARARLPSTLMVTTAALRRVGPFTGHATDSEWVPWCVALTDGVPSIGYVDQVLVRRRIHAANKSLQASTDLVSWSTALRSHLAVRRLEQQ
jgi:glycosyltransferase involved in cell wall biosynthesis